MFLLPRFFSFYSPPFFISCNWFDLFQINEQLSQFKLCCQLWMFPSIQNNPTLPSIVLVAFFLLVKHPKFVVMLHLIIKFLCDYPLSFFTSQLSSICYFEWSLHKFLFCSFFCLDFDRNQQNDYFLRNLLVIHHPNLLGLDHCNLHSNPNHCEWVSNFLVRFILKLHPHYPMQINSFSSTPILGWDASTVI